MIIQTPELLIFKKVETEERVGKNLLVCAAFEKGLAFGAKYNKRQNKPNQWLFEVNATCIVGGIGDLHDFQIVYLELSSFCQEMASVLGGHYITGEGLQKYLAGKLREEFEENAKARAVNFIVADWHNGEMDFWFIDFDGRIKQLKNFAVAGGSEYQEPLTEEEMAKLDSKEKKILEIQKSEMTKEREMMPGEIFMPAKIINPQKMAIAYLERFWKHNMNEKEIVTLIKNTLFTCSPELEKKMIEISVLERCKDVKNYYFPKK